MPFFAAVSINGSYAQRAGFAKLINGPKQPSKWTIDAAMQLFQTGHSNANGDTSAIFFSTSYFAAAKI